MKNAFQDPLTTKITSRFNSAICAIMLSGCVSISTVQPTVPEMPNIPEIDTQALHKRNEIELLTNWVSKIDDCNVNGLNFIRCATLLKLLADKNPNIRNAVQEAMTEHNIDGERLKTIKQATLTRTIENNIDALSLKDGKPNLPAHRNLLMIYDGNREEFSGLEEFARETIDGELAKRSLDIDAIRNTHELEMRKRIQIPVFCITSNHSPNVLDCQ